MTRTTIATPIPPRRSGHTALRRGRWSQPGRIYLVTSTTADREPVFATFSLAVATCSVMTNPRLYRDSRLLAWVLMPDHAHWLLELGHEGLGTVVARIKSATARAVNRARNSAGRPVWTHAFHDRALRREDDIRQAARYIIANPLRAGLATSVRDYPYWDAIWLRL